MSGLQGLHVKANCPSNIGERRRLTYQHLDRFEMLVCLCHLSVGVQGLYVGNGLYGLSNNIGGGSGWGDKPTGMIYLRRQYGGVISLTVSKMRGLYVGNGLYNMGGG